MKTKVGKKTLLKSFIVLLRAKLNFTIYVSQMGQSAGVQSCSYLVSLGKKQERKSLNQIESHGSFQYS